MWRLTPCRSRETGWPSWPVRAISLPTRPFRTEPGSSCRLRTRPARSSPAWTISNGLSRLGLLGRTATSRYAHHPPVEHRCAESGLARSRSGRQMDHVLVTYDGSRKAAGVQVYFDGEAQPTAVQADALQGDIHTDVPLKIGQRNASASIPGLALQDLRIYRRALTPPEARSLAKATRLARLSRQARTRTHRCRENRVVRLVVADARQAIQRTGRHRGPTRNKSRMKSAPGHHRARHGRAR